MNKLKISTGVIMLFFLISCNMQRQVWFSNLQQQNESHTDKISRAYIDKYGYLYPPNEFIPRDAFFDPQDIGTEFKEIPANGNLLKYYLSHPLSYEKLALKYNVHNPPLDSVGFNSIQKRIIKTYSDELNRKLAASKTNTLVLMIHGFNVEDSTEDYILMRQKINESFPEDFVYLDVYWDGLTANERLPFLVGIWGRAQLNSGYVAITVRRILHNINPDAKIRMIAHSLGSSVSTGALFNTYKKFKNPPQEMINEFITFSPGPSRDIRLGMIAPAIPGRNSFRYFFERGNRVITNDQNNIHRVILGINTRDFAVSKVVGLSKKGGSTSLGGSKKEFEKTKKLLVDSLQYNMDEASALFQKVDFTNNSKHKSEHSLRYYLMQEQAKNNFIKKMFQ